MTLSRVGIVAAAVLSGMTGLVIAADRIALPDTPYSIVLPGSPECGEEPTKSPMGFPAQCEVEVDGLKYTFDYMVLPYEVPSDQAEGAMFALALGHARATGGDIVDKQVGDVGGFLSMDFTIVAKKRRPIGYGRHVIVRNHLVRAMVEATGGSMTRESAEEVLKSMIIE